MDKIVTNGCSGNCCEKFTLPVTYQEIKDMLTSHQEGKTKFIDRFREESNVCDSHDLENIADMLIPLGISDINPQTGKTFNEELEAIGHTKEDFISNKTKEHKRYIIEDFIVKSSIYTCRHYDKEKRICNNYENRPNLCRIFGNKCSYTGCKFTECLNK